MSPSLENPIPRRRAGFYTWWEYRRDTIDQFRRVANQCDRRHRRDLAARAARSYRARMKRIHAVLDPVTDR